MNIKRLSDQKAEKKSQSRIVKIYILVSMMWVYCSNTVLCEAAAVNFGEKIGKWGLDQLFWICLFIVCCGAAFCLFRKAYAGIGAVLIIGGLVCYFIKNPEKISTIGNSLASQFGF